MRMLTLPHFALPVNIDLITRVRAYGPYWCFKRDRCISRKGFLGTGKPYIDRGWSYINPAEIRVYFAGDDYISLECKPGEVQRWWQDIDDFLVAHSCDRYK